LHTLQEHHEWRPQVNLPPAPGSAHRILRYDAATGVVNWEGRNIGGNDPIPD
jgi:choline-sulfatase